LVSGASKERKHSADSREREKLIRLKAVVLFLHVSGAIGYFNGIGSRIFVLFALRRAKLVEQVRAVADLDARLGPFTRISVLLLLVVGLSLAFVDALWQSGWIEVALISLMLLVPLAAVLLEPRRRVIEQLAREAPEGLHPSSLEVRISDPILPVTLLTVATLLLGLVFLMITKPDLLNSLIVMGVALLLGLAPGLLVSRGRSTREPQRVAQQSETREPVG
jgi:hypothetical protein